MVKKEGSSLSIRLSANFVFLILISSIFSYGVFAAEGSDTTTQTSTTADANGVHTIIICDGGDKSSIDAAIAASISAGTGVPVLYTEHGKLPAEVIDALKNNYPDLDKVVVLGGNAVVSKDVQTELESLGSGVVTNNNFDVARIAGVTATDTAVNAINYIYGPEAVDKVTIVAYEGDNSHDYDRLLQEAAQLGGPIIPIPKNVKGLPADVVDALKAGGVGNVNVVGSFDNDAQVKGGLDDIKVNVDIEVKGENVNELENKLEEEVINHIGPGEDANILLVQEGSLPPVVPGQKVFFWKDDNHDNLDDNSGAILDGIGRGLYDKISGKGGSVYDIKWVGKDEEAMGKIVEQMKKDFESQNVKVDLDKETNLDEVIKTNIKFNEDKVDKISDEFKKGDKELRDKFEEHKDELYGGFNDKIEQFKTFYAEHKDELSSQDLTLAAKVIEEASKNDIVAAMKGITEFKSEYQYANYVKSCEQDSDCVTQQVADEKANLDERAEGIVGVDRAREVANLDAGQKLGLLEVSDFVPPGKENELKQETNKILDSGVKAEELHDKYAENHRELAYNKYTNELKEEYAASGKKDEAARLTSDEIKRTFDDRLRLESQAYQSGVIKYEQFNDPAQRADIFAKFGDVNKQFDNNGIKGNYLTSEDWKSAYESYNKEGKISDADIKRYEAAATAYKTWEASNPGVNKDPTGAFYDSRTGQYSYNDHEGRVVSGVYKEGKYTYTDENGKLVQGDSEGHVQRYDSNYGGWTKNTDGSWTGSTGEKYIPPSDYNKYTGTYDYKVYGTNGEGKSYQCGSAGCYSGDHGGQTVEGTYSPSINGDGQGHIFENGQWKRVDPNNAADAAKMKSAQESGNVFYSPAPGAGYYSGGYTDPGPRAAVGTTATYNGKTYTVTPDKGWTDDHGNAVPPPPGQPSSVAGAGYYVAPGSSGGVYEGGGCVGTGCGAGYSNPGYSGSGSYSGGGYYSGSTGGTYSGGSAPSGGSYSGGGYSGGSYSGGSYGGGSYSGGSSGGSYSGGSAPSGGGDSGGGGAPSGGGSAPTGAAITDIQGKGLLASWLRGRLGL